MLLLPDSLTGAIPKELGDLPDLRSLCLNNNRLEGDVDLLFDAFRPVEGGTCAVEDGYFQKTRPTKQQQQSELVGDVAQLNSIRT